MSKIKQQLHNQIIDQVLQHSQASRWHLDSKTCNTEICSAINFNLLDEQDICENAYSESVADPLNTPETGEWVGLDRDIDSDDGGVSIQI
ncbi:hypothetical protein N7537_003459 [Penicillium hordei]|uniref:Uncharacterized protein n=1 Tax=Penicillium hordei TaxID=40994 RepID=A0AAD6H569_9EURO|nr:uncharacterized protein N7537_003459 [Penicillium hordei]KAJ5606840.1 hypothetical protein N7537_003459 [Penicillium hordei]